MAAPATPPRRHQLRFGPAQRRWTLKRTARRQGQTSRNQAAPRWSLSSPPHPFLCTSHDQAALSAMLHQATPIASHYRPLSAQARRRWTPEKTIRRQGQTTPQPACASIIAKARPFRCGGAPLPLYVAVPSLPLDNAPSGYADSPFQPLSIPISRRCGDGRLSRRQQTGRTGDPAARSAPRWSPKRASPLRRCVPLLASRRARSPFGDAPQAAPIAIPAPSPPFRATSVATEARQEADKKPGADDAAAGPCLDVRQSTPFAAAMHSTPPKSLRQASSRQRSA